MLNLAELANAADLADSVIMSTLLKAGIKLSFKITSSLLSTSFGLFSFFFLIIGFFLTTFLGFFPPLDGIPSSAVTFLIVSFFAISFWISFFSDTFASLAIEGPVIKRVVFILFLSYQLPSYLNYFLLRY